MGKILFLRRLSESCAWGGAENQLLDYFMRNDHASNPITLAVTQDIFSEKFKSKNVPVEVMTFPFTKPKGHWPRFWKMFYFLISLKPKKIIYVQGAMADFVFSEFLAGFFATFGWIYSLEVSSPRETPSSRRHFGLIQGFGIWKWPYFVRAWLCRRILCVGQEVSSRLVNWYNFPRNKMAVVYVGVDTEVFKPDSDQRASIREKLGIGKSQTLIISTGRLSKEKRFDRLINAFDSLASICPNVCLVIVGDGAEEKSLKKLASSKSSNNFIFFEGFHADVAPFLQAGDIFVLPSDIEGLSNSLLEAMCTGLVCISTDTSGAHEIINSPDCGYVVEKTEEAVLRALEKAVNLADQQRIDMGTKARQRILAQFAKEENRKDFFYETGLSLNCN